MAGEGDHPRAQGEAAERGDTPAMAAQRFILDLAGAEPLFIKQKSGPGRSLL
jgi:hypothetical protein